MGHLLLVDNDPDILELLEMGLVEAGHEVKTARNGVEALRSIEDAPPDVLITDLIMPNIGGEKLLKIVHSVPEWRSIKTIVVSGVAIEAPEIRAETPCDIYIAKGPIASTLQYLKESLENFEAVSEQGRTATIGAEGIFSRHITRELLEFKQEVDQILDHISDGVCKVDRNLTIVWLNRAFSQLVGTKEESLLGKPIPAVLGEAAAPAVAALAQQTAAATRRAVEISLNQTRVARASLLYPFSHGHGYAALLWQDVTERLLLEEQYENIVESANDLIWTTNLEGNLSYVSRAARRIVGVDPEVLQGRPVWVGAYADDQPRVRREFEALLTDARNGTLDGLAVSEWRFSRRDDSVGWAQTRTSALRDRAGRTIGLQGTMSDITDQRALMEEREALLHEVHHRVRDNLQLIGSLARLSAPELLETRITALGEVFDELYRERSFSDVETFPLVLRVVNAALATHGFREIPQDRVQITVSPLPMRRAVPLTLMVNEIVHSLCKSADATPSTLSVMLQPGEPSSDASRPERRGGDTAMTLQIGTDRGDDPATQYDRALDGTTILALLIQQVGGSARVRVGPTSRIYIIGFA